MPVQWFPGFSSFTESNALFYIWSIQFTKIKIQTHNTLHFSNTLLFGRSAERVALERQGYFSEKDQSRISEAGNQKDPRYATSTSLYRVIASRIYLSNNKLSEVFAGVSLIVVFQLSLEVIATIMASLWLTFLLMGGLVARARSHTYKAHISLLRSTDGKLPQIRSIWRDASQGQTGTPWDRALTRLFRFYHATKNKTQELVSLRKYNPNFQSFTIRKLWWILWLFIIIWFYCFYSMAKWNIILNIILTFSHLPLKSYDEF